MSALLSYESDSNKIINKPTKNKEASIDKMMKNLSENTKKITKELNEREKINTKIQARLDFMKHIKKSLSEKQIEYFAKFITLSHNQGAKLSIALEKIHANKDFKIMISNADYTSIVNKLHEITEYQAEALSLLKTINTEGDSVLHIL